MQCRLFYCIMENEQRGMITFILAVCGNVDYVYSFPQSPPSRAAWIEMSKLTIALTLLPCRRLHGRRGLKCNGSRPNLVFPSSPPSRAAWIEIATHGLRNPPPESPPSRAAWIEIFLGKRLKRYFTSPPSRAAWIEIKPIWDIAFYVGSPPSRAAWIEIARI